jgi:hypothetical protein
VICQEAREALGAEPHALSTDLQTHLGACSECTLFQREMATLETDIRKALELGPLLPGRRAHPRLPNARWRGWAVAAALLLALLGTLLAVRSTDSLARDVVAHVALEPESWKSSWPLDAAAVDVVLSPARVALASGQDRVVYARTCLFHGRRVPHLVVQTRQGPVTVLILRDEHVESKRAFHEDGFTGVLSPAPHGSIAVLAKGDAPVAEVGEQLNSSVRWLDDNPWPR